jgi:predicted DNA-binding transcriptional regulator AlpA
MMIHKAGRDIMNKNDIKNRDRAIRPAELQQILGLSRSSIHRLETSGQLPKKRKYGGGTSCYYLESEIIDFLRSQPTG